MLFTAKILFWLLLFCMLTGALSSLRSHYMFKFFRILLVLVTIGFFSFWLYRQSGAEKITESINFKINNKTDKDLDFYCIQIKDSEGERVFGETEHFGNIRSEHFREDNIALKRGREIWITGYDKDKVYVFRQIYLASANVDQTIDVVQPFIQSRTLCKVADRRASEYKSDLLDYAAVVIFDLLFLFILSIESIKSLSEKKHAILHEPAA